MVAIGCICPLRADGKTRHPDGDLIELRERFDFRSAITMRNALAIMYTEDPDAGFDEVLAVLSEKYILHGVESWSLVGPDDKPIPVTKGNIREYLLADTGAASLVADVADGLYQEQVMLPLLEMASTSSPPSSTDGSTSAQTGSPTKHPTPSSPSLTESIPTDSTEPTSIRPDGVSSTSRKPRSAA